ncbi:Synergin gamma [Nymphon striatum]|nr:Synergin gamma [Nymphon striatum]
MDGPICGYPFQNIDVLNSIPQPPIPNFYSQTSIQQAGPAEIAQENASVENSSLGNSTDVCEQSSSHKTMSTISTSSETGTRQSKDDVHTPAKNIPPLVPPNEIPVGHAITESVSAEVNSDFQVMEGPKRISGNYRRAMLENQPSEIEVANIPGSSLLDIAKRKEEIESLNQEMSKKHDDDDFDNFVSATQPNSVTKNNNNEDFADFKHASRDISSTSVLSSKKATNNVQPVPSDLMSLEHDKYSAFRELDVCNSDQSETDFGDFVNADATAVSNDSVELVNSNQDETSTFQADFTHQIENPSFQADFTNQIEQPSFQADFSLFDNESNPDNEFGDFKSTDQNEILKKSVEKTKSSKKLDPFSTAETQSNSSLELSNFDAAVNMNKDSLSLASLEFDQSLNQSDFKRLKKDNSSLGENQSITSLEFGSFEFGGQSSESSKSPISKSDSTPSLELRVTTTDSASLDANDEFGDMLSAETSLPAENYEITHKKPIDASYVLQNSGNNAFIIDKYSSVRSSEQLEEDTHRSEWYKCLQSCKEILITANSIFNRISSKAVCSEVLSTEEGSSYFKNIIEVYRVVERVAVSINSFKKCNTKIGELLKEINLIWNNLSAFIAGTAIMPEKSSFDFSLGVFSRPDQECTQLACGVCLLHVDAKSKACELEEDSYKLTYGGRHYHSACANLWVNCVDSILPSLPLPQLL